MNKEKLEACWTILGTTYELYCRWTVNGPRWFIRHHNGKDLNETAEFLSRETCVLTLMNLISNDL